jgi:aminopeptidase N
MRLALVLSLVALPGLAADLAPEVQFSLLSLKDGERKRLEAAVGPLAEVPLVRAELDVRPEARRVVGQVSLTLTAKRLTDRVYLRLTPNATHPGAVELLTATVNGQRATVSRPDPSLVALAVDPPVDVGGTLAVSVRVQATLPALSGTGDTLSTSGDGRGGDYGAFSQSADVIALSGLLPMVPPEQADGTPWEGPSGVGDLGTFAPTNFVASVSVPNDWQVVSAGHLLGELPDGAGRRRFAWAVAGARELPLLAVKGYRVATKQVGGVTVESHFLERDEKAGRQVLEHAAKALELLEAKLGPYPYKALRVVEARLSGGAGGMEFPGLVTVSAALYRGAVNPAEALGMPELSRDPTLSRLLAPMLGPLLQDTLEFTVNHEVAHQYFAMLVGSDCIAEPVADEALTQHVALLLLEWRRGKEAAEGVRANQLRMAYQVHRMLGGADGPANRPTHEFDSNTEYAALVYGKAPLLFDAQRKLVGDAAWLDALKRYVADYRYRWASADTFTDVVARVSGNPKVKALQRRWWNEARGDEDLGGLDLGGLLAPAGGAPALDPAAQKQLEAMMKQLMGE